jgi:hypothetical protein
VRVCVVSVVVVGPDLQLCAYDYQWGSIHLSNWIMINRTTFRIRSFSRYCSGIGDGSAYVVGLLRTFCDKCRDERTKSMLHKR